jgi:SNF2 family DNA or RNA helicase
MNFILPDHFADSLDSLRAIFKVKGDQKVTLLAQERVSRAKKMMTPFVLRRRKDQVCNRSASVVNTLLSLVFRCSRICRRNSSVLSGAS